MASPSELSLEEIRKYLLDNGGSARNQDLVKHFKKFLTDPESRVEARNRFKEYINTLATIKTEEGEKYLVLKKKFRQQNLDLSSPTLSFSGFPTSPISTPNLSTPTSPLREPPPYRPPPVAPLSPISNTSSPVRRYTQDPPVGLPLSLPVEPPVGLPIGIPQKPPIGLPIGVPYNEPVFEDNVSTSASRLPKREMATSSPVASPPVPPRRKSQDKIKLANKENQSTDEQTPKKGRSGSESIKGNEDDDRASVASQLMDGKSREWLVRAAQGDYQALAKLAAEEPRLARTKDPSSGYTALHWGAKHGDENIVKLIAGTCKDWIKSVNETSNGGYTPLHIALQFDHENIFNLLVQVYGANQDIRDYSGKKPRQYSVSQKAAVSQDTMRKIKARKKHAEKDLGFLRIGSLNVRVKRTTEAFNQFLGVTTKTSSNNSEKIHKTWGSADNLPADKMMPPPKYAQIKKRRSRRATDFVSSRSNNQQQQQQCQQTASQPSTPTLLGKSATAGRRPASVSALTTGGLLAQTLSSGISTGSIQKDHRQQQQNDSDSDGACGFDSAWRGSA
ncbi:ankyrin repeat domain-containing protein SOWAHC isoform X5 [Nasonia vitripennis]|uniref:SOWAHA-C winged helix-turn-helix domain-containing protein n=1 Tax=Nasonia vitripennis TaxID=7425 RepID=A0A7M7HGX4_NASVI|nr:ankyrin repeat domain-containing protein SOWAHC isoform X5 [Nasonia vitripennis]